jgi:nitric oxide dioxygenase
MFGTDLTRQKARLMEMLSFLVEQIEHPEILEPMLSGLEKRHEAYGVKPDHYTPMGQVLLTEMALTLGERWTPEVETAWKAAFQAIVDGMGVG